MKNKSKTSVSVLIDVLQRADSLGILESNLE